MKKATLISIVIIVLIIIFAGMFRFNESGTKTGVEQKAKKVEVSPDLIPGIQSKERLFNAADPEFPSRESKTYHVEDGVLPPHATEADKMIWEMARKVAPSEEVFLLLKEFIVYFDEEEPYSMSIYMIDDDGDEWSFEFNYRIAKKFKNMIPVMTHEFAHVMTLKNDQIVTESEQRDIRETCDTYLVSEGCLAEGSYLLSFFNRFYKDNPDYIEHDRQDTEAFFETRKDAYTTEYATTNPVEDIAEAFMYYVSNDMIAGDSIKAQKVRFFTAYPELVEYREKYRETVMGWAD